MNIIHICITIRLNYPMTPLYHYNKTYVCASSRYEIMIHKQYLAYQYTILHTPLELLYKNTNNSHAKNYLSALNTYKKSSL